MLVSIDPGVKGCGIAWWECGRLIQARYEAGDRLYIDRHKDIVIIELPQVYQGRRQKGDPNDLIKVAFAAGRAVGGCLEYRCYLPSQWKGQLKKEIAHPRYLKQLSEEERQKIEKTPKSLIHNVYDAIGIGLFHLKNIGVRK